MRRPPRPRGEPLLTPTLAWHEIEKQLRLHLSRRNAKARH
jgi:hypothetical protein